MLIFAYAVTALLYPNSKKRPFKTLASTARAHESALMEEIREDTSDKWNI